MLDDLQGGRGGLRGHLEAVPLRLATRLIPATTLATAQGIQDIASAMAATLAYLDDRPMVNACRTEGRGGQRMIGTAAGEGIWKDSTGAVTQQFTNFVDSARRMAVNDIALSISPGWHEVILVQTATTTTFRIGTVVMSAPNPGLGGAQPVLFNRAAGAGSGGFLGGISRALLARTALDPAGAHYSYMLAMLRA